MSRRATRFDRNGGNDMPLLRTRPNVLQFKETEPIMLEYLQNIDRELSELKKKREIIEEQHGYFQNPRQPVHDKSNRQREFSYNTTRYEQLYDDPEPSRSTYNNSQSYKATTPNADYIPLNSGRKRPYPWQNDNVSKRFSGFVENNIEKSFGSRLGHKPSSRRVNEPSNFDQNFTQYKNTAPQNRNASTSQRPKPLMSLNTSDSLPSIRTEFKSKNKVSKSKVASKRANNLNAYPVASRKALIEQTIKADASPEPRRRQLVGQVSQASKKVEESFILHADMQPTPKIHGRLELAVGHILKSIKEQTSVDSKRELTNQPYNVQRLIKQIIRDRLRNLMLGKHVGPFMQIVAAYREQFPIETDQNMLKAVHATEITSCKLRKADSAEEFLKLNMSQILRKKLNEMFKKLKEIYTQTKTPSTDTDAKVDVEVCAAINDLKTAEKNIVEDSCVERLSDESKNLTIPIEELDNVLQQKLPHLLKKYIPFLTEIMNLDYTYESSVAEVIVKTNSYKAHHKMVEQLVKTKVDNVSDNVKKDKTANSVPATSSEKILSLHYVKVIGKPTLPKRKVMQTFLDQFKPKTVKKHKKQHNLLFVGFIEKKNYDDVIAKNGITIGKFTLEIKPSEPTGNTPEENVNTDDKNAKCSEISQPHDTIFGSELDDQINDLLLSIRQGEEKDVNDDNTPATENMRGNDSVYIEEPTQVVISCDSDSEKIDDEIIEVENSNSVSQSHSIRENRSEDLANETGEIADENQEIIEVEKITEETKESVEKTEEIAERTEETTGRTEEITERTEETTERTEETTGRTEEATGTTEETTEMTEKIIEKTDEMIGKTGKNTESTKNIIEKTEEITVKTQTIPKETEETTEKMQKDLLLKDVERVENNTLKDKSVETKEVTQSDNNQTESERSEESILIKKNEGIVEDDNTDSNNSVKAIKRDENAIGIVRGTPTRASSRLTNIKSSSVQTRATSKLTQNND